MRIPSKINIDDLSGVIEVVLMIVSSNRTQKSGTNLRSVSNTLDIFLYELLTLFLAEYSQLCPKSATQLGGKGSHLEVPFLFNKR